VSVAGTERPHPPDGGALSVVPAVIDHSGSKAWLEAPLNPGAAEAKQGSGRNYRGVVVEYSLRSNP
jgi:hypothetical protein